MNSLSSQLPVEPIPAVPAPLGTLPAATQSPVGMGAWAKIGVVPMYACRWCGWDTVWVGYDKDTHSVGYRLYGMAVRW